MNISYITVSQINDYIKRLIEQDSQLVNIIIKGEVASLSDRGHIYFTIKDSDGSTLKAVLFNGYRSRMFYIPKIGDEVLLYGSIEVYTATGSYQLIVKDAMQYGEGARLLELEKLRKKLQAEGLFDENHKKKLPKYPQKIGIITAKSGAAIHDILRNLYIRFPIVEVEFFNASVQGENAKKELTEALLKAQDSDLDLIIIGRGGGDKEDLSAFNDENLVRTIYRCPIPVISAVGHESDYTLVDYVADVRASTPTDAAIKATPNINDILINLDEKRESLRHFIADVMAKYRLRLENCSNHQFLKNPTSYYRNLYNLINLHKNKLEGSYTQQIKGYSAVIAASSIKINNAIKMLITRYEMLVKQSDKYLTSINPMAILDKGYSITMDESNRIISSREMVDENMTLKTRLKDGIIISKVAKR